MIKISATIITFNEAQNIQSCVESLEGIADEVIVIDSYSTDETVSICKALGCRVIQRPFQGYADQKNYANEQAAFDFILSMDADEVLSSELRRTLVQKKKIWQKGEAFSMNRLNNYCGKWIKYNGWYPDKKIRLWHKAEGKWGGNALHEHLILEPSVEITHLEGDLLHYTIKNIEQHVNQVNKFSSIKAHELQQKSIVYLFFKLLFNPFFRFVKGYFFKMGFRDGFIGLMISIISAYSEYLKYGKAIIHKKNLDQ